KHQKVTTSARAIRALRSETYLWVYFAPVLSERADSSPRVGSPAIEGGRRGCEVPLRRVDEGGAGLSQQQPSIQGRGRLPGCQDPASGDHSGRREAILVQTRGRA